METTAPSLPRNAAAPRTAADRRVLFISHEASRTGAPMFLLHFVRWLRRATELQFDILIAKGGPLEAEFAKVATVYSPKAFADDPALIRRYALIYANTVCSGLLVDELGAGEIPVVTHAHELEAGYEWQGAFSMALSVRQTARFVACAKIVGQRLHDMLGVAEELIDVRYEMIDPKELDGRVAQSNPARLREAHGIPNDAFVVAGCGTLDLRKGVDLFVQAAALLSKSLGKGRPLRFLWIGAQTAPDLLRAVTGDVRKLGLKPEIQFTGELPSPHGLLALSDVYWLPSREDPFPLSMLEAGALGRPVLCFDGAGGGVEFCALGGGVTVPYLDVAALADRTAELYHDRERRAELGARASALVRERFVVDAIAPQLWGDLQGWLQEAAPLAPSPMERTPAAEIYGQWPLETAPGRAFIQAHQERWKAIRSARSLSAAGRKAEAIKLLLTAASAGIATKDPWILIETLIEVGAELAPLEPQRAAAVQGEADRVAQSNPVLKAMAQAVRRGIAPRPSRPR